MRPLLGFDNRLNRPSTTNYCTHFGISQHQIYIDNPIANYTKDCLTIGYNSILSYLVENLNSLGEKKTTVPEKKE